MDEVTGPVIYVCGPYRGHDEEAISTNIARAAAAARVLWEAGFIVLCPHVNLPRSTVITRATALAGDLVLMKRCDALWMLPGWPRSAGAKAELVAAKYLGLPNFDVMESLRAWAVAWKAKQLKAKAV